VLKRARSRRHLALLRNAHLLGGIRGILVSERLSVELVEAADGSAEIRVLSDPVRIDRRVDPTVDR
jgi:hypothetical protein